VIGKSIVVSQPPLGEDSLPQIDEDDDMTAALDEATP
jgi:hypothetical protein